MYNSLNCFIYKYQILEVEKVKLNIRYDIYG